MSSFMSVRKNNAVCFCRWLQLSTKKHQSCPGSTSFHLMCSPPPPAEMSGEMKVADRQRSSSDDVQHSRRTSCGEKLDVNAGYFLLLLFSAPRSTLTPTHHHHPLLGLPIWAPNMHSFPETDSECATFCNKVVCYVTEEGCRSERKVT